MHYLKQFHMDVLQLKSWLMALLGLGLFGICTMTLATEKGLFWQLEAPSGSISYLFGTIHTDDYRVTDFSQTTLDALKKVDLFVMETQPNSNPMHFKMATASLATMVTEAEMVKIKALTDFHVMHLSQVLRMKPWLLAVVFSQSKPQTPYAQDNLLMRSAEDFAKPVKGLEASDEHFGVIDGFSLDEQLLILRTTLQMTDSEKERDFEKLLAVYETEDSDALLRLDAEMTGRRLPSALWQRMRVKLLDERNVLMAERALDLAQQQSVFIAVGAAHLAGDSGLIHAFKKAGYRLSVLKR